MALPHDCHLLPQTLGLGGGGTVGGRAGPGVVGTGVCRGQGRTPWQELCVLEAPAGAGARCRARRAVGAIPGRCHGNQTSLRRDKQLDILARFLQD